MYKLTILTRVASAKQLSDRKQNFHNPSANLPIVEGLISELNLISTKSILKLYR
ncbi:MULTISPECIES: hypothetical protein [unclassified Nostoc]|uniref:hypothetical protein n=1 Tax=unclassified Nostoc TaxID=2593658 RepID=UPI00168A1D4D|nr:MULTISPECIES: hypothetical protein [unclassified Nostoc]